MGDALTNTPINTNSSKQASYAGGGESMDPGVEPTETKTSTATPTLIQSTATTTLTPVPTLTPTPTWIYSEAGEVVAPILLYHHIDGAFSNSRYSVSVSNFREQMETLHILGYAPVTIKILLNALLDGGTLPAKPIVITFDDGHHSVYDNAFPIMQEYGFPGVFYIVANRIEDVEDFVNVAELKEMIASGWEIGSHSFTHADITKNHSDANREIAQSKKDLETALGTEVETFAYPFGAIDPFVADKVANYGYRAAMGLGTSIIHDWNDVFYLQRLEVYGHYTIEEFLALIQND
jgi:peptidoglycan/xylan/chitin deacetylase (PgdA/CDA1 family)